MSQNGWFSRRQQRNGVMSIMEKVVVNADLLKQTWPSQTAAQAWLRRRGTNAGKLGCTIGMAVEGDGVSLFKSDKAAVADGKTPKAARKAKANGKTPKVKDEGAVRASDELVEKALRAARRANGVTRKELRAMRLEAGVGTIAWVPRLERLADEKGLKFKIKHDGRHPTYFATA
jgi:hypothetical protein